MKLKYFQPRFAFALVRNIFLKLKYGSSLSINPFKVYIEQGVRILIKRGGKISFDGSGHRIYITRGCDLFAIGGSLEVGSGVFLNKNCTIVAHEQVTLGAEAMLAPNVAIFDSDHAFSSTEQLFRLQGYKCSPIKIGSNVWLGTNVVVTKGSEIENNVVVGANSVVRGKLDTGSVYAGSPVKLVRKIGI